MSFRHLLALVGVLMGTFLLTAKPAESCPFCSAVAQTFSEEMSAMDVVVLAKLIERAPDTTARIGFEADVTKAKFEVVKVIKGEEGSVKVGDSLETIFFGDAADGDRFLVTGVEPPRINWSTPLRLSDRACEYVTQLPDLPESGAARLTFFIRHLEDSDEMLARDAYDEFAKAPYADVIDLKPHMDRAQLIAWIQDPDIPATRKRLYLTMLGVCGSKKDLPLLEELMQSPERRKKAGLDAMIACYLTLKGADGMPMVEDLFLKNKDADYADTYAAISALRFHGTEGDIIPRERIVEGLEYMLDRPRLADLVIPDLARWEDWGAMDRLVALFKSADEKTSWVRVPVINYLRACPLPEAKAHLKVLAELDPDAMRRANTFFPLPDDDFDDDFGDDDSDTSDDIDNDDVDNDEVDNASDGPSSDAPTDSDQCGPPVNVDQASGTFVSTAKPVAIDNRSGRSEPTVEGRSHDLAQLTLQASDGHTRTTEDPQLASAGDTATVMPSFVAPVVTIIAVSLLFCVGLFLILWGLLTGRIVRLVS